MRHLVNEHSVTSPASSIYKSSIWVLTNKNLIYLLNLQYSSVFSHTKTSNCFLSLSPDTVAEAHTILSTEGN